VTRSVLESDARASFLSSAISSPTAATSSRDLQLKAICGRCDLLEQTIELAPAFASAWFTLGEIASGSTGARPPSQPSAPRALPTPRITNGASLRLMQLGAEAVAAMPTALCAGAVRPICTALRDRPGRRSRLSRPGLAVQGRAVAARRSEEAAFFKRAIISAAAPGWRPAHSRKNVDRFIGIDISPRMIEKARLTASMRARGRRHAEGISRKPDARPS